TFLDRSTMVQTHAGGGPRGHLSDGFFQSEDLALPDVLRDHTWKISIGTRMRQAGGIAAARLRSRSGIAADASPGKMERGLDVLLAHHVVDGHHASLALRNKIERSIGRVFTPLLGDIGHVLSNE